MKLECSRQFNRWRIFRRLFPVVIPGAILCLLSNCERPQPDEKKSLLREAWDAANDPGLMLGGKLTYGEISDARNLSGEVIRPWSDSYWPINQGGVARRWIGAAAAPPFSIAGDPHVESDEAYFGAANRSLEKAMNDAASIRERGWLWTWSVSPAEKYDIAAGNEGFDLTRSELDSYISHRRMFEKNDIPWGWMGHCHGWAEASLALPAPERSVLARNRRTGEQVILSAGDVRALVTKIASDNGSATGQRFAGTRCEDESENIPRDRNQRIVDAALGIWDDEKHLLEPASRVSFRAIFHSRFDENQTADYPYAVLSRLPANGSPAPGISELIWVQGYSWLDEQRGAAVPVIFSVRGNGDGNLLPDMVLWAVNQEWIGRRLSDSGEWLADASGNFVSDPDAAARKLLAALGDILVGAANASATKFAFKSFKECRDINPATFHTALLRWIGKASNSVGRGFVMDNARAEQVWNQGIWRYRSQVGELTPLQISLNDGTSIVDPYKAWRAAKSVNIVDVETTVDYGVENGPFLSYGREDEASGAVTFRYTLEFDAAGNLVGGEWHAARSDQPLSGAALLEDLRAGIQDRSELWQDAPDFVWGNAAPEIKFRDSRVLRASVVEALLACSTSKRPADGSFEWGNNGVLPYVTCDIE